MCAEVNVDLCDVGGQVREEDGEHLKGKRMRMGMRETERKGRCLSSGCLSSGFLVGLRVRLCDEGIVRDCLEHRVELIVGDEDLGFQAGGPGDAGSDPGNDL